MLAKANDGSPGRDEESFEDSESRGLRKWWNDLRKDRHDKTYRPQPVKRVRIEKPGGGERPLGIPTIRDRVAQTAAKLVLEPILEADLEPNAYGYRPRRSAQDAIRKVDELLYQGYTDIVDADLSKYFDTIPHSELLQCVARRVVDKHLLHLLKMWLKAYRARIVNYADDFVILSRGKAKEALEWTRGVLARLGLTLNEKKTSLRDARKERFDFSGIYIRTALQSANGAGVYRLQSVEEEREQGQEECEGASSAEQHGLLGGGSRPAESETARLASVFPTGKSLEGVGGARRARGRACEAFPETAAQGAIARHWSVFHGPDLW